MQLNKCKKLYFGTENVIREKAKQQSVELYYYIYENIRRKYNEYYRINHTFAQDQRI